MKKLLAIAVGSAFVTAAGMAQAATTTANLSVSATVAASCTMSGNTLAFGSYTSGQVGNLDGASSFSVTCSNGAAYTLALDTGLNALGGTFRMFDGGTGYLNYGLYSDAGRVTSLYNGTNTIGGTGSGASQVLNVYGRIPSGQTAAAGSFSDTVVATLTY